MIEGLARADKKPDIVPAFYRGLPYVNDKHYRCLLKKETYMLAATLNAVLSDDVRQPLTLDSADLFVKGKEVRIRHAGEEYRLRLTSNNKLILTK